MTKDGVERLVGRRGRRGARRRGGVAAVVAGRPRHVVVLAGMLALGVLLRLWITVTWKPAFVGYYDAGAYARAARDGVFTDLFRPAGYPVVMRILHVFSDRVLAVTAFQHLLGIATALISTSRSASSPARRGLH